ncbi:MAG: hypothetical protein WAL25_13815 [Acidimicrobiia bacterium]
MSTAGPNLVSESESEPIDYFQVGVADRAMALLDETSAVGFEAVVELRGPLDEGALTTAWRRVSSIHPIVTCVRTDKTWRPVAEPPIGEGVTQPDHHSPPVALQITRTGETTRLTMMCSHVAFDGVASRILLGDLRDEYEATLSGIPPRIADWSPRTLETIAGETDWRSSTAAVVRSASAWWRSPISTHVDPGPGSSAPADDHAVLELGPVLGRLTPARRKYGWSVDAVLVGILEKTWSRVFGRPTGESTWLMARDLRPALGMARGIGNLSAAAGTSMTGRTADLATVIDRAQADLVGQDGDLVTSAASVRMGAIAEISFGQMLRRSKKLRAQRSLSNVGQVGDSLDRWGPASLDRIWFVGPLAHPPYNSFIATGHGDSTLVSVRTSPAWLTADHAGAMETAALSLSLDAV